MSVGRHFNKQSWDTLAFDLLATYQAFCAKAQALAAYLAPLTDQNVIDSTAADPVPYTGTDVVNLKSGAVVAKALADLSAVNVAAGSINTAQAATASQAAVALGKFGGGG